MARGISAGIGRIGRIGGHSAGGPDRTLLLRVPHRAVRVPCACHAVCVPRRPPCRARAPPSRDELSGLIAGLRWSRSKGAATRGTSHNFTMAGQTRTEQGMPQHAVARSSTQQQLGGEEGEAMPHSTAARGWGSEGAELRCESCHRV